jgi:hypothetical protein
MGGKREKADFGRRRKLRQKGPLLRRRWISVEDPAEHVLVFRPLEEAE